MGSIFRGSSGSGGTQQVVQSTNPPDYLAPYLTNAAQESQRVYQSGTPNLYPGQMYATTDPATTQAINALELRALSGSPLEQTGVDVINRTAQGAFLNANPYFGGAMEAAARPVINQFNEQILPGISSQFSRSGRFGSGAQQRVTNQATDQLTRNLADATTKASFENYNTERARQQLAAQQLPSLADRDFNRIQQLATVGASREAIAQQPIDEARMRYEYAQNAPQQSLDAYINRLRGVGSNYGVTTSTSPLPRTNPILNIAQGASLGGALGGLAPIAYGPTSGLAAFGGPVGLGIGLGGLFGGLFGG